MGTLCFSCLSSMTLQPDPYIFTLHLLLLHMLEEHFPDSANRKVHRIISFIYRVLKSVKFCSKVGFVVRVSTPAFNEQAGLTSGL